jgi:hypothetical protein
MYKLKQFLITSLCIELSIAFIQFLNVQLNLQILDYILPLILINTFVLFGLSITSLIKKQNPVLATVALFISLTMIMLFYLVIQALKTFT